MRTPHYVTYCLCIICLTGVEVKISSAFQAQEATCPAYRFSSELIWPVKRGRQLIWSHKSYHPYNEKNKARVREDESRAAEAELAKEQKRVEKVCPQVPFLNDLGLLSMADR